MHSIKRRISIILVGITVLALGLTYIFVNFTMNNRFNQYMKDIQNKRDERIVSYFQEIYKRDNTWTSASGIELRHEAYMSNYCLTLLNKDKEVIWTMDASELQAKIHSMMMSGENQGVYISKDFPIKQGDTIVGYVNIGQYSSILLSEEDLDFKKSINRNIIASTVLTLLIAVLLSLYISNQFSSPIAEVADISVALSNGKYNIRSIKTSSILELENLRTSINTLGERLKSQDDLRKRLVSDISHEIRTPLNILENNLEAMIDGVFPVTTERLVSLNNEVIRFGKLLNNLNVLKELEAEDMVLNLEKVSLSTLADKELEAFSVLLRDKAISVHKEYSSNECYDVLGDYDKLKQVFINILSNAEKFNKPSGDIWVSISKAKDKILVKIKDNGLGIKKEDLPFVFERLYRGDKSRHEIQGSGIGLTIAKNIMLFHCGTIDVQSQEGTGTEFTLTFNAYENES